MSSAALNNLIKIKDIKSTPVKITSEYRLSSVPIAPKNKRIAKTFAFQQKINNPQLLKKQIALMKEIPSVHSTNDFHIEEDKQGQKLVMIEQYLPNGDLTEYIDANRKLDTELLIKIAQAIGQLHHRNIYHINLKPENILFETNETFKFNDLRFPYLHSLIRKSKLHIPNSPYTPPEADGPYLREGQWDIWSLGIIFMELTLQRRIKLHEVSPQNLPILMDQIEYDRLRNVIKGMVCERDLRLTIKEVIKCLKECKSEEKGQIDFEKYIQVRLKLFSCDLVKKLSPPIKQQAFRVNIDSWVFSFTLMHLQSNLSIVWITATSISSKTTINIVYSSLPSYLQDQFADWEALYKELKTAKHQNFNLHEQGYLTIKVKIPPPVIGQPQPIVQNKQIKQSIASPTKIFSAQSQLPSKSKIQAELIYPQPLPKQIEQSQPGQAELIFDSDSEVDILTAYKNFPKSHSTIAEITQRLEIMTKLQKPDIDLISMSYEQMGGYFYDQSKFTQAKDAYKLARQGYIRLHNKQSLKEMNLLIELGNTYSKLGDFQKSIRCFRKSAFLAQQNNDEGILGIAYKNWASVALHLKDDQTAQKCFVKCVEIYQTKPGLSQQLMAVYANLSNTYLKRQQYAKSNECIHNYNRLNQNKKGDKAGVLNFNLGFGLIHLNQFKEAFQAIRNSLGEKYKESMRTEIEKILIGALRKKKQQIKQQLPIHKESITSLRKLLQSAAQKNLDALLA